MNHVFLFVSFFFLCIFIGNAQESILKHTVEKGETVFQLSRKYNVTPEEIYALNPGSVEIIKIGEVLSIPKKEIPFQSNNNPSSGSNLNTTTYAVVYGDTKYSLARRFGISIEEFERQNPHTINRLQAGHILKIEGQGTMPSNFTIAKTHLVLKGQTLWGISKANELTVEELVNANSDILNGILQIGQVLKIPEPQSGNRTTSGTYVVKKGDTKYGLSKKYKVTISELERENPQIVTMLMAGQTIRIPNDNKSAEIVSFEESRPEESEVTTAEEQTQDSSEDIKPIQTDTASERISSVSQVNKEDTTPEKNGVAVKELSYESYEIQPKETLYGLSKKAGMSISDFVNLNPELSNGVRIGAIVKMPMLKPSNIPTEVENAPNTETLNKTYVDLSQSIKTIKKNQIILFVPFSESQHDNEYDSTINYKEVSDDFVREHLEFYRGSKIAQDSARASGLDFNLKIVETNTSPRNTKAVMLAKENNIENSDAILLPYYENDVEDIATLVEEKNIPVITIGTAFLDQGFKNVYTSVPSLNSKRDIMLDYMIEKGGNVIVVCDVARKESKTYISGYAPNAHFIEVNKNGLFNSTEFESLLDVNKVNYVILESEKNSVFLSTTNLLLGQLSRYSIQLALLDKSLIPNSDDVSNKRFVILEMLYPSITPLKTPTIASNFIEAYTKTYGVQPSQNVKYGFDLTLDTLLRTSQEMSFEESADQDITEYTTLKFDYKSNDKGSHDNKGIYIIQYNSDGSLKEIK